MFGNDSARIIRFALESHIVQVCGQCEKEHGIHHRPHPAGHRKSHGLCRRHTIAWAKSAGLDDPLIHELVKQVEANSGWPKDLGQLPART